MKKVLVGMSGGVDSTAAAMILKEQGYSVTGVTLKMFSPDDLPDGRSFGGLSDADDAGKAAEKLGIPHIVADMSDLFKKHVMEYFARAYENGETPNPCVECNRHIKFGAMLKKAEELGFDYIATGHYARIEESENKRLVLLRPEDSSKDQTYVLYSLNQRQLARTLFPLSGYEKDEIRRMVKEAGLLNADKPDSQDICFVPNGDYAGFIKSFTKKEYAAGNFINPAGEILGVHQGIINYTIGQRKGLGIALGRPVFVTKKSAADNAVTLGQAEDLYTSELYARDLNWISIPELSGNLRVTAKTRYSQKEQPAIVEPYKDKLVKVSFDEPQRAVTPGQAVVFYDGNIVVGGGTII